MEASPFHQMSLSERTAPKEAATAAQSREMMVAMETFLAADAAHLGQVTAWTAFPQMVPQQLGAAALACAWLDGPSRHRRP